MIKDVLVPLASVISDVTQRRFEVRCATAVGGGDISQAYCLEGADGSRYFLKLNDAKQHAIFAAEAAGLNAIAATGTLRVPQPIVHGVADGHSYLVLEHLALSPRGNPRLLGAQLAALHRCTSDSLHSSLHVTEKMNSGHARRGRFGFARDNFIGTTPQPNRWKEKWIDFWGECRLGFQLRLAAQNGYGEALQKPGEKLLAVLPAFFDGYSPRPSLLHGDLWGGNHAFLADGTPVIFDPAVYYGDRECDLAMAELFGGYPPDFYAAYRADYPLDAGYAKRRDLYNLYHLLNHANLFGGGYARQAVQMIAKLLASA
ncbi:MAG: fructosamine kinase family protein [Sideroxyarcus sp.]|nr:fructosamine kinase family protein [Sideroxyarcus sp.]